jgi:hypothetical protein
VGALLKHVFSNEIFNFIVGSLLSSLSPPCSRVPLFDRFGRFLNLKVIDDAINHLQIDLLKGP